MLNALRFRGVVTVLFMGTLLVGSASLGGCSERKRASNDPASIRRGLATGSQAVLQRLAKQGEKALPILTQMLGDSDPQVVGNAAVLLSRLGERAAPAAVPLVQALARDVKNPNLQSAVQAVGAAAVPELINQFRAGDAAMKREFAIIISWFGKDAAPALNDMIGLLDSSDEQTLLNAISAIGAMGTAAKPAIPRLEELANSAGGRVGQVARSNIRRINLAERPGMRDMQDEGLIPR